MFGNERRICRAGLQAREPPEGGAARRQAARLLYSPLPTPYALQPTPYTLHPTSYTSNPTPCTPTPNAYNLSPNPDR